MTPTEYRYAVLADLYRETGSADPAAALRHVLRGGAFAYLFWLRTCAFALGSPARRRLLYPAARLSMIRLKYKLGISIPVNTKIGPGFYIGHFGEIIVNGNAVVGRNCNISQGVTLGESIRGPNKGFPTIGDNVYIGPGVKIVGAVRVGNDVAIGANCVVTKDVPDGSVVVGVPGRVISDKGSEGYILNADYDRLIGHLRPGRLRAAEPAEPAALDPGGDEPSA